MITSRRANLYVSREKAGRLTAYLQDAKPGWNFSIEPNPEGDGRWSVRAERTLSEINELAVDAPPAHTALGMICVTPGYLPACCGHVQVVWVKHDGTIRFP
jgi:hypothetical protein